MTRPCPLSKNLAELLGRPADDPFWSHAESCPSCRAAILAYGEFLDPGPANPDFDLEEADRELARRLDRKLAASPAAATRQSPWARSKFWYGLAAVLMVGIGFVFSSDLALIVAGNRTPGADLLRGDRHLDTRFTCRLADEGLVLSWPECDTAIAILFDDAMTELARIAVVGQIQTTITDGDLVAKTRYSQVLLMSDGDIILRGPILAPEPAGQ